MIPAQLSVSLVCSYCNVSQRQSQAVRCESLTCSNFICSLTSLSYESPTDRHMGCLGHIGLPDAWLHCESIGLDRDGGLSERIHFLHVSTRTAAIRTGTPRHAARLLNLSRSRSEPQASLFSRRRQSSAAHFNSTSPRHHDNHQLQPTKQRTS